MYLYPNPYLEASVAEYIEALRSQRSNESYNPPYHDGDNVDQEALRLAQQQAEREKSIAKKANERARAEKQKRQREAVEKARQEADQADQNHDLRKLSDWRKMPAHIKDKSGYWFDPLSESIEIFKCL